MKKTKAKFKSGAFEAIHSAARGLHRAGTIDKATMRDFDESCLTAPSVIAPEEIKRIREGAHVSQPVFARYLNTSESTVQKWEAGTKRPSCAPTWKPSRHDQGPRGIDPRTAEDLHCIEFKEFNFTMTQRLVVAGASGLVGRAALERFSAREGWEVIGLSRRKPIGLPSRARHISVDLLDRDSCAGALGEISNVGYLIYAALSERTPGGYGDAAEIDKNDAMFANALDPLASAPGFRHVGIVHGGKAYGVHLPGMKLPVPLYEDMPRHSGDNFYYRHEDYVKQAQKGAGWHWTILRACHTYGAAVGSNINGFFVLVVFAALCREAGRDLPMPEGHGAIGQPTDADLIAEALDWAMAAPGACEEIFNINNGDPFANFAMLPILAQCLGMKLGPPRRYDINVELDKLAHLWPGMVDRYNLDVPKDINALLGGSRELAANWTSDVPAEKRLHSGIESTSKIRLAGFHSCVDSRSMIRKWVKRMQNLRMIP